MNVDGKNYYILHEFSNNFCFVRGQS